MTGGSYDQLFYQPTVLANVPAEARAYQEEIFGPVTPILAFKDIDEAAQLAAQTGYRAESKGSDTGPHQRVRAGSIPCLGGSCVRTPQSARVRDRAVTPDAIMTRTTATASAISHRTQSIPGLPFPPNAV
jgi:hypothetical protein